MKLLWTCRRTRPPELVTVTAATEGAVVAVVVVAAVAAGTDMTPRLRDIKAELGEPVILTGSRRATEFIG